jgi:hypothetical protein
MKRQLCNRFVLIGLALAFSAQLSGLRAQNTVFTYQGQVMDNGAPFTGIGQFEFALVTSSNASYTTYWSNDGTSVNGSEPAVAVSVPVTNGLFMVALGNTNQPGMAAIPVALFNQPNLQLRIWFNDGVNGFAVVNPAQNLTPTPYATIAATAVNLSNGLTVQSNAVSPNVVGGSAANSVSGGIFGATIGGGGETVDSNSVTADFGTVSGGDGNVASGYGSTVGGGLGNAASGPDGSATVGGGYYNSANADDSTVGGGYQNTASGDDSIVGGGVDNNASSYGSIVGGGVNNNANGNLSTVGGGTGNIASGFDSTVAGGFQNQAVGGGYSTVGGGQYNSAGASAATVGGGQNNNAIGGASTVGGGGGNAANGLYSIVGGGYTNIANVDYSTVGGGRNNTASGFYSTISGGYENSASGPYSTVPGGVLNVASGNYSFAAGFDAQATNDGSFVWADDSGGSGTTFSSTANNQFAVRATGGILLAGDVQLSSSTYHHIQLSGGNSQGYLYGSYPALGDGIHLGYNFYYDAAGNGHVFNAGGATSRLSMQYGQIVLAVGQVNGPPSAKILVADGNGVTVYGTFNNNSDRNAKQDFAPVSSAQMLEKVDQLPITEWSYKEDPQTRHVGPVAQDFYSIFNIGTDDKHIAPIDEGGVALAAVQGLNRKLESDNAELKRENNLLARRLDDLEAEVAALAKASTRLER